mgnify:CR=1 FL=1
MLKHRKENLNAINYTKAHRKSYKSVEKQLLGHNTWRSLVHDLDKVILYNFLPFEKVKSFHRKTARHHKNNLKKNRNDYIDMIIDWECARFTKPDKPLNAYDTLYKFYPEFEEQILPILKEFKLDHHTQSKWILKDDKSEMNKLY